MQWHRCPGGGGVTLQGSVEELWRCGPEGCGQWALWGGLRLESKEDPHVFHQEALLVTTALEQIRVGSCSAGPVQRLFLFAAASAVKTNLCGWAHIQQW